MHTSMKTPCNVKALSHPCIFENHVLHVSCARAGRAQDPAKTPKSLIPLSSTVWLADLILKGGIQTLQPIFFLSHVSICTLQYNFRE